MASSCSYFFTVAVAVTSVISTVSATEFQVGDAVGWRIPATNETQLYNVWASRRRFHTGDSLRFHYKNDSVAVVEKWGFYHCDSSNPISVYNDGDTIINLDTAGTVYFISGNADRCKQGENMMVTVMSPNPISQFPPSIAGPPENPYSGMSPSPSQFLTPGGGSSESSSGGSFDSPAGFSVSVCVMAFTFSVGLCSLQP